MFDYPLSVQMNTSLGQLMNNLFNEEKKRIEIHDSEWTNGDD